MGFLGIYLALVIPTAIILLIVRRIRGKELKPLDGITATATGLMWPAIVIGVGAFVIIAFIHVTYNFIDETLSGGT